MKTKEELISRLEGVVKEFKDDPVPPVNPKPPATSTPTKPKVTWIGGCPNYSSRNGEKITHLVLHHTDGPSASSAINWFLNPDAKVSAHYIIERDGKITQMVKDADKAWHCYLNNSYTIGIEVVHQNSMGHIASPQEAALIELCKWLMAEYKIPKTNVKAHNQMPDNIGETECNGMLFGSDSSATTDWVQKNL